MSSMVLLLNIVNCNSIGASNTLLGASICGCGWWPITRRYCCPRRSHIVLIGRIIERSPRRWPIAMTRARVGRLMRGNGAGMWLLMRYPSLCRWTRFPTGPRESWLLWWGTRAVVVAARGSVRLRDARVVVHLLLNLLSRCLLVVVGIVADLLLLTAVVVRRRRC